MSLFTRLGRAYYMQLEPVSNQYRFLQLYLIGVVVLNICMVFFKGYSGDLSYWTSWLNQLHKNGYEGFDGNYPPIYIHWLYLVTKLYSLLGMPIENNNQLKFFTQLPIIVSHYFFVIFVYYRVKRFGWSSPWFHMILAVAAFSPAIFLNGPVWGQVDLLPVIFLIGGITAGISQQYSFMLMPLYALSLLTKFQMIAFAPVVGILFFLHPRSHIIGLIASAGVVILAFSPWIILGEFINAFNQAYIATLGQYPKSTFNAANLWLILTGNNAEDTRQILRLAESGWLNNLGQAKYLGMFLFSLISLLVFLKGFHSVIITKISGSSLHRIIWCAALICALAFFSVLPAMHERYMFPAVLMAIMLTAENPRMFIIAILVSAFSAANMVIILEMNGSDIWLGLSILNVAVLCIILFYYLGGKKLSKIMINFIWGRLFGFRHFAFFILVVSLLGASKYIINRYEIYYPPLAPNQIFLGDLQPQYASQDHGRYQLNRSYSKNKLSINNKRYGLGIGTHSNSRIDFELPTGAKALEFRVGLDDVAQLADIRFSIAGDGNKIWQSDIIYGHEIFNRDINIDLTGLTTISLIVDSVSNDQWDHANWVNLILTLENNY